MDKINAGTLSSGIVQYEVGDDYNNIKIPQILWNSYDELCGVMNNVIITEGYAAVAEPLFATEPSYSGTLNKDIIILVGTGTLACMCETFKVNNGDYTEFSYNKEKVGEFVRRIVEYFEQIQFVNVKDAKVTAKADSKIDEDMEILGYDDKPIVDNDSNDNFSD